MNLWKKSIRNQKVTQGGEGLALSREDSNSKNPLDQDKFFHIGSQNSRQETEILCSIVYNCIIHWLHMVCLYIHQIANYIKEMQST